MEDQKILPACELASPPVQRQRRPPHRILVAEDDMFFRQISSEALSHSGYAVDAVEDGAAAWAALSAGRYDLLITDNSMPKVTGVELLKKLHAAQMALPVIMATGAIPEGEFSRCPGIQPAVTLLKPYPVTELLRMVKKVLTETKRATKGSQRSGKPPQSNARTSRPLLVGNETHAA